MTNTHALRFAIMSLVGPGDEELKRIHRMLQSLFFHEPGIREILLIDDRKPFERLREKSLPIPDKVKITILENERQGTGEPIMDGICIGVLQALRHLVRSKSEVDAVIKLDADALVIRPFTDKLARLMEREPNLGTAGVVEFNCDGSSRVWGPYDEVIMQLSKVFRLRRHKLLPRRIALWGRWNELRRITRRARSNGYRWGEHSQGGSYLISRRLIERMDEFGYLDHGSLWRGVFMCEDPMMGLYSRACGFRNIHFGREREVFGCAHKGLPFPPEELIRRGYSIVHSLKNDTSVSEKELAGFFMQNRMTREPDAWI